MKTPDTPPKKRGRPAKLNETQLAEIARRFLDGEGEMALAREFGVSRQAIRLRMEERLSKVKHVANQILAAESELNALPITSQHLVQNLAAKLRDISDHLAGAARYGAATAHRLNGIAHAQVQRVDDAEPERSMEALQRIGVLTKMANSSAEIGLTMLSANKKHVEDLNRSEGGKMDMSQLSDTELNTFTALLRKASV